MRPPLRTETPGSPQRVVVVGGGCAGLTAAFELTRPEHGGRYAVTVYQMGWRLGGKGASGRGVAGRIEEHGLHLWMGFYENAFRLMRECYEELGRDPTTHPVAGWQDAFKPAPCVAVTDRLGGDWEAWVAHFPAGEGLPGDPLNRGNPFSLGGYLSRALALAVELLRSAHGRSDTAPAERPQGSKWPWGTEGLATPDGAVSAIEWLLRHGQLATVAAVVEATQLLRACFDLIARQPAAEGLGRGPLLRLIDALGAAARQQLERLVETDLALRRTWQVVDLILAIVRGAIAHGLALSPQGFDAIDDYDWREWLALHGASEQSLQSGFVRGIYDLAFAYENGDPTRPRLSAAAALRGAMRMFFTYRGALFWRMSAGMGDIVFAPLYEVLKRRGVRFEFFHRLERVRAAQASRQGERYVEALEFSVQATVAGGVEYEPLVDVGGLPCWPSEPNYSQLNGGAALGAERRLFESPWESRVAGQRTLLVGEHFDFVVLALGGGAIPAVCSDLIECAPRWRTMADGLHTVATQAFQVWLTEDMSRLGWRHPPVNLSGWVEPFDTWADMTHLTDAESFSVPVASIAYFCSPMADPPGGPVAGDAGHAEQYERVRDGAVGCLSREVKSLWPGACDAAGGFRWELLVAEPGQPGAELAGPARFATQFWTANARPSDRYAVSLPGSARTRLSPLDLSFDNLTVAGDWTESGLNTGCVESAVMSGLLAAHALSDSPPLESIIGYDHP